MQSFIRTTKRVRLSSPPKLRHYTPSSALLRPTALHRATEASDLAKHPESGTTQEKKPDVKHNRHWTEANSTISEADVKADRDADVNDLADEKVATYGERGFG